MNSFYSPYKRDLKIKPYFTKLASLERNLKTLILRHLVKIEDLL